MACSKSLLIFVFSTIFGLRSTYIPTHPWYYSSLPLLRTHPYLLSSFPIPFFPCSPVFVYIAPKIPSLLSHWIAPSSSFQTVLSYPFPCPWFYSYLRVLAYSTSLWIFLLLITFSLLLLVPSHSQLFLSERIAPAFSNISSPASLFFWSLSRIHYFFLVHMFLPLLPRPTPPPYPLWPTLDPCIPPQQVSRRRPPTDAAGQKSSSLGR